MREITVVGKVYRLDMDKISFEEYYQFLEASVRKDNMDIAMRLTRMFRKALGVNQAERMPHTHFFFALNAFSPILQESFGGIQIESEADEIVRRKDEEA